MAKVLAGHYRYVTKKDGEPVRVLLAPGDTLPSGFDKDEAKRLEEDGLLVDEKRLTEDGLRIPHGSPDREVKVTETSGNAAGDGGTTPKTSKTTGTKDGDKG